MDSQEEFDRIKARNEETIKDYLKYIVENVAYASGLTVDDVNTDVHEPREGSHFSYVTVHVRLQKPYLPDDVLFLIKDVSRQFMKLATSGGPCALLRIYP